MTARVTGRSKAQPARLWIRVLTPSGGRIGPGMIALLKAVDAEGSIAAAARALGMSYRRAWLLLEQAKDALGAPVIATSIGGAEKGGATLSESGARLIALYDRIEEGANAAVAGELEQLFSGGS
jgi:molybdate transport system regulatory protein